MVTAIVTVVATVVVVKEWNGQQLFNVAGVSCLVDRLVYMYVTWRSAESKRDSVIGVSRGHSNVASVSFLSPLST